MNPRFYVYYSASSSSPPDPTVSYTNTPRNLPRQPQKTLKQKSRRGGFWYTKIIPTFTGTSTAEMTRLILRTPYIRTMSIPNIMKKMNFLPRQKERRCDGMDGGIAPSLVKEAARAVEEVKVLGIHLRPEKPHIRNLEIRPKLQTLESRRWGWCMAEVVVSVQAFGGVVDHEVCGIVADDVIWMTSCKVPYRLPQRRYRVRCQSESVKLGVLPNSYKDITNPYFLLFSRINLNGS